MELGKKLAFGSSFMGSTFSSVASPKKRPRTESQTEEHKTVVTSTHSPSVVGHDPVEGEDETEGKRNDEFGNMLEHDRDKNEDTSGEQQYVQLKKPLVEQELVTGEEDEMTLHSIRAKLYVLRDGSWKERGTGQVRINRARREHGTVRIVMRADGVLRVILNTPLFARMDVQHGGDKGNAGLASDRFVRMVVLDDSKPLTVALKVRTHPNPCFTC